MMESITMWTVSLLVANVATLLVGLAGLLDGDDE